MVHTYNLSPWVELYVCEVILGRITYKIKMKGLKSPGVNFIRILRIVEEFLNSTLLLCAYVWICIWAQELRSEDKCRSQFSSFLLPYGSQEWNVDLFTHLASQILFLFSLELMVTLFSLGAENVGLSNWNVFWPSRTVCDEQGFEELNKWEAFEEAVMKLPWLLSFKKLWRN